MLYFITYLKTHNDKLENLTLQGHGNEGDVSQKPEGNHGLIQK